MSKHTPGKWEPFWTRFTEWGVRSDGCVTICEEQIEGNARLIAAAPDLLEALRELRDLVECLAPAPNREAGSPVALSLQRARAAIAKAEGR